MLIDEDGGPRAATAPRLSEFLREKLECVLPAHTLKLSIPPHHRSAIAIRIVKTLQRRLSTRAQRAAIYRMIGISLELDGPSITGLSNDAACRRAFATGGRVIGRYAGHCLIGRNQIWNELLHFFGSASQPVGFCSVLIRLVVTRAAVVSRFEGRIRLSDVTVDAPPHVE